MLMNWKQTDDRMEHVYKWKTHEMISIDVS